MINKVNTFFLGNFQNISGSNKHYFGFSELYNEKIFIKIFIKKELFESELFIISKLYFDRLIDYLIIDDKYYLILKYMKCFNITENSKKTLFNSGILLADFHKKLSLYSDSIQVKMQNNLCSKINNKFGELDSNLKKHLIPFMNFIYIHSSEINDEYHNLPKTMIHGDFGYRNIKYYNNELVLIDFERCHINIQWYDFVKLFYREAKTINMKTAFLKGYKTKNELFIPSKLIQNTLIFDVALGIYIYTSKYHDKKFCCMANNMINDINNSIGLG